MIIRDENPIDILLWHTFCNRVEKLPGLLEMTVLDVSRGPFFWLIYFSKIRFLAEKRAVVLITKIGRARAKNPGQRFLATRVQSEKPLPGTASFLAGSDSGRNTPSCPLSVTPRGRNPHLLLLGLRHSLNKIRLLHP